MLESDLEVYAMGIFDPLDAHQALDRRTKRAEASGGVSGRNGRPRIPVSSLNDLPSISARIGNQLRNQYLLGYSPLKTERDGKYRIINVRVIPQAQIPDLRVYFRHGYYSPGF